ncbi:RNA polymerase sigma-70 factor [Algoriphagus sp. AGSA1]|uniref:RNA polymerase sigma factor n=1 Tax=Algoriphagus sp. AGSA1 TaxID=2907213 RepID=UPI001F2EAFC6|nr:RNA polymerase sigma-70 factor [Algoriphagus sp. AGSA1]MCE7055219.1 RNA polymerase sigma-70 factor [Algoriphagus sp. AGSA1]
MMNKEDNDALAQLSCNNTDGLKYIFDKYYNGLCDFATIYVRPSDVSSDLVSDFFIRFWNQRHQIKITGSLRAYLYKSVKNACLNHLRGRKVEMMNYEDYSEVFISTELSPDEQMEFKEFQDKLDFFTNSLPDRRKLILQLKLKSGFSNSEVAEALQISESTVKNQMRAVINSLKEKNNLS